MAGPKRSGRDRRSVDAWRVMRRAQARLRAEAAGLPEAGGQVQAPVRPQRRRFLSKRLWEVALVVIGVVLGTVAPVARDRWIHRNDSPPPYRVVPRTEWKNLSIPPRPLAVLTATRAGLLHQDGQWTPVADLSPAASGSRPWAVWSPQGRRFGVYPTEPPAADRLAKAPHGFVTYYDTSPEEGTGPEPIPCDCRGGIAFSGDTLLGLSGDGQRLNVFDLNSDLSDPGPGVVIDYPRTVGSAVVLGPTVDGVLVSARPGATAGDRPRRSALYVVRVDGSTVQVAKNATAQPGVEFPGDSLRPDGLQVYGRVVADGNRGGCSRSYSAMLVLTPKTGNRRYVNVPRRWHQDGQEVALYHGWWNDDWSLTVPVAVFDDVPDPSDCPSPTRLARVAVGAHRFTPVPPAVQSAAGLGPSAPGPGDFRRAGVASGPKGLIAVLTERPGQGSGYHLDVVHQSSAYKVKARTNSGMTALAAMSRDRVREAVWAPQRRLPPGEEVVRGILPGTPVLDGRADRP